MTPAEDARVLRDALAAGPTLGPWKWVGSMLIETLNGEQVLVCGDDGKSFGLHSATLEISDADRSLIVAASPDRIQRVLNERDLLIVTLRELVTRYELDGIPNDSQPAWYAARAVLSKSTGAEA